MENVQLYSTCNTLLNAGMGLKFIGTGEEVLWKKRRERNGTDAAKERI
jgi:hypothetical protein